jgi:hypothetical protein
MGEKYEYNFRISGLVYGNLWGGGCGAYPAEKLACDDKKKLIANAKKMLKDGSLDSGMGYESLKGAYLTIETITTIVKDKKEFKNSEFEDLFIGKLTKSEKDFLKNGLSQCEF